LSASEAKFTINVKDGIVELEGKESFVDKHLEKFEEIFKTAVKEAIGRGLEHRNSFKPQESVTALPPGQKDLDVEQLVPRQEKPVTSARHQPRTAVTIHPILVDL
jgi:hypothetical protein